REEFFGAYRGRLRDFLVVDERPVQRTEVSHHQFAGVLKKLAMLAADEGLRQHDRAAPSPPNRAREPQLDFRGLDFSPDDHQLGINWHNPTHTAQNPPVLSSSSSLLFDGPQLNLLFSGKLAERHRLRRAEAVLNDGIQPKSGDISNRFAQS